MISFFFIVIGLIIILSIIHTVFIKDNKDSFIPASLGESDLWQDGETLKYYYHGQWYEAVSRDANKVYIYDEINNRMVGIPFREDI
jgi:hypothetical protein